MDSVENINMYSFVPIYWYTGMQEFARAGKYLMVKAGSYNRNQERNGMAKLLCLLFASFSCTVYYTSHNIMTDCDTMFVLKIELL